MQRVGISTFGRSLRAKQKMCKQTSVCGAEYGDCAATQKRHKDISDTVAVLSRHWRLCGDTTATVQRQRVKQLQDGNVSTCMHIKDEGPLMQK